jgi:hypothetical protein
MLQIVIVEGEFQNKTLRRKFGSKTEAVTGGWGKLHNKEAS